MAAKRKARKGGREKKPGPREANGKPQRNIADHGTPEIKARKVAISRSDRHELTPLGILAGHGLITEEMYRAADRYRTLHYAAYPDPDRPSAGLPFLARLPSDQWPEDVDFAIERMKRGQPDEIKTRGTYHDLRGKLTNDQQEIVHTLAIYGEWPSIIDRLAHEIVAHRMRWHDDLGLIHGNPPSIALKKAVATIREALDALFADKSRLRIVSKKDVVSLRVIT